MAGTYGNQQLFFESVSAVTATKSTDLELGTLRHEGGRIYRYVYNASSQQILPHYGVVTSVNTGFSVTLSSVTSVDHCFGVVRNATLTTGTYGWVVKEGFTGVKAGADDVFSAADSLVMGALGVHIKNTGATGYLCLRAHGQVMQATASAGTGYAYVNCL